MSRFVACRNLEGKVISDAQCDPATKPLAVHPCGDKNCPAHWVEQEWDQVKPTPHPTGAGGCLAPLAELYPWHSSFHKEGSSNAPVCPPIPQGLWHLLPSQGAPLEGSNVLRKSSSSPTSGSQLAVACTSAELCPESALTSPRFWSHH